MADAVAANPDEIPDPGRFAAETGLCAQDPSSSQVWFGRSIRGEQPRSRGEKTSHVDLAARARAHPPAPQTVPERERTLPANGLFIGKRCWQGVAALDGSLRRIVGRDGSTLPGVVVASA